MYLVVIAGEAAVFAFRNELVGTHARPTRSVAAQAKRSRTQSYRQGPARPWFMLICPSIRERIKWLSHDPP